MLLHRRPGDDHVLRIDSAEPDDVEHAGAQIERVFAAHAELAQLGGREALLETTIALAAKVFGADRILFGTDSGPTSLVGQTITSVKQAALTTEEKQQILIGNGRRLLEAKGVKA